MICLYDSKETNFNHNGLVVLEPILCDITEELNGMYELELEHSIDDKGKWQLLLEDNIIKADGQLFRIYRKKKNLTKIHVNARHIFYDLLDNFLEDVRPTDLNGAGALNWMLSNTQYPHGFNSTSDISTINTAYFVRLNPVEAIFSEDGILGRWKGELVRDNFTIKLLGERGLDRGVHIAHGKNIKGIEEELNMDTVITRLMPLGYDGLLLPEKYIDSPLINNYSVPKIRKVEFSSIKIDEQNGINESAAIELLRSTANNWMQINKCDIPFVNYKVDFIELSKTEEYKDYAGLERVYLGDIVTIKHKKLGFDLKSKCIKYKKDIINDKYKEIELGNFKENIGSSTNKALKEISQTIEENKSSLKKAIDNATNLLTTALGGYVIKRNGEILIMDTEDPNTAEKVWRWNLNGLGYSKTGINGPYGLAITMDGAIVADFMTTGSLDANLLKVGTITSQDGSVSINLSDGTFKIGGNDKVAEHTNEYSSYKHSDGTYTEIGSEGLLHVEGNTKKQYHYLLDAYEVTIQGNESGFQSATVNIPTKFAGKKYKIIPSVSYVSSSNQTIGAFGGYLESIDYAANTATFKAYVNSGLGSYSWTVTLTYFIIA